MPLIRSLSGLSLSCGESDEVVVGDNARPLAYIQHDEAFAGPVECLGCGHLFEVVVSTLSALVITCSSCGAHNVFLGGVDALEALQQASASVEPFA